MVQGFDPAKIMANYVSHYLLGTRAHAYTRSHTRTHTHARAYTITQHYETHVHTTSDYTLQRLNPKP
jgi:hypothetical protein